MLQTEHHGFGVTVPPRDLILIERLEAALRQVLTHSRFKVRYSMSPVVAALLDFKCQKTWTRTVLQWWLRSSPAHCCAVQVAAEKVQKRLRSRPREPAKVAADKIEEVLATQGELYLNPNQYSLVCGQVSNEFPSDFQLATTMLLCLALVLSLLIAWLISGCFAGHAHAIVDEQNSH